MSARFFVYFGYVCHLLFKNREIARFTYIEFALGSVKAKSRALSAGKQDGAYFTCAQKVKPDTFKLCASALYIVYSYGGNRRNFADVFRRAGNGPEGSGKDRAHCRSDCLCGRIYPTGLRRIALYGILRDVPLGL